MQGAATTLRQMPVRKELKVHSFSWWLQAGCSWAAFVHDCSSAQSCNGWSILLTARIERTQAMMSFCNHMIMPQAMMMTRKTSPL
jgi:hypothetical protein